MKDKKESYQSQYMAIGMCMGVALGTVFGELIFDNMVMGTGSCLCLGMAIGCAVGSAKDKRIAEENKKNFDNNKGE